MKQIRLLSVLMCLLLTVHISSAQSTGYQSYSAESKSINELSSKYGGLCKVVEIGKSAGKRIIYALEIGKGENRNKPALLVIAGVETDDLAGTVAAKNFAEQILARAETDSVKNLLSKFTLYVIPRLSPDPLEGCFGLVKSIHLGDDFPIDQDKDGKTDEDDYNDIDHNGMITLMRILDPAGEWIENPDDPMLMKKAEAGKGETGKYKVMFEGVDDDKDGLVNEDPAGGININKNTAYNYKPNTGDGGLYPFQAPELKALDSFIISRPNIIAVYTFNYHNNILDPWSIKKPKESGKVKTKSNDGFSSMISADSAAYKMVVEDISSLSKYKGDPQGNGDIPGWVFYYTGRLSFCAPAWTYPEIKNASHIQPQASHPSITREQLAYRWIRKNEPQNFLDWKEVKHPDFPNNKVEIGGFYPFAQNNPPEDSLKSVAKNSFELLYGIFKDLPDINVDTPLVEQLGKGVSKVTLAINNKGKMPLHTNGGGKLKTLQPFLVKAKLAEGQKIKSGKKTTSIKEPIPGGGKIMRTFVIAGTGKVEFNIGSPSGGFKTISVQL